MQKVFSRNNPNFKLNSESHAKLTFDHDYKLEAENTQLNERLLELDTFDPNLL